MTVVDKTVNMLAQYCTPFLFGLFIVIILPEDKIYLGKTFHRKGVFVYENSYKVSMV